MTLEFYDVRVGLPDPTALGEPLHEVMAGTPDIDRMRAAIAEGQRHSAIIRAAMMHADIRSLSGEDRYTLLAYHALIALERQHKELRRLWNLIPNPAPPRTPAVPCLSGSHPFGVKLNETR